VAVLSRTLPGSFPGWKLEAVAVQPVRGKSCALAALMATRAASPNLNSLPGVPAAMLSRVRRQRRANVDRARMCSRVYLQHTDWTGLAVGVDASQQQRRQKAQARHTELQLHDHLALIR
jgi:hypothetical protein